MVFVGVGRGLSLVRTSPATDVWSFPIAFKEEDHPKRTPLRTSQLLWRAGRAGSHIGTLCDAIHRQQLIRGLVQYRDFINYKTNATEAAGLL